MTAGAWAVARCGSATGCLPRRLSRLRRGQCVAAAAAAATARGPKKRLGPGMVAWGGAEGERPPGRRVGEGRRAAAACAA